MEYNLFENELHSQQEISMYIVFGDHFIYIVYIVNNEI